MTAVPGIPFHATAILGLTEARLTYAWVSVLGWLAVAAHVLVLAALGQGGPLSPDGLVARLVPVTSIVWILAVSVTVPRRLVAR